MPELLSVHGRCPRCGQVLVMPAGQLQSVFRCARCQYRALGAALVDEARASPPKPAAPVLRPFDEDSDDQRTRVHLPGSDDEQSEVPLLAVPADAARPSAPPAAATHSLQRFDASAEDPDDQQTRLHVAGSFDAPQERAAASPPSPQRQPPPRAPSMPPPPPPVAAPRAGSSPSTAPQWRGASDATLLGVPQAPLTRFDRVPEDPDDQATRLHFPADLAPAAPTHAALPSRAVRDQTLIGVAPAPNFPSSGGLMRFERAAEDGEDQHTRLQVPISYEDEPPAPGPDLRPLVAPRRPPAAWVDPEDADPSSSPRFARATLELSRWIEDWVRDRHAALLCTLALLCAVVAPLLDAFFGNTRRGATVIAANLVLFFLWTLAFAWFGKLRNDAGVWDYRVGWTRLSTGARLVLEDLGRLASSPWPLKWRVVSEVSSALGLIGLGVFSVLTLSQLVWGHPTDNALLLIGRASSGMLVLLSVVANRQTANAPLGFDASPEVTAPAVAHLPAVVDLSMPLSLGAHQTATPVHQMLELLSHWPPREWPNRDSYVAALERHLLRHMGWARIEREHWLGETRADGVAHFVVNDGLLLEVMRGFDAEEAERISAKMRMLAKSWRGKPAMIVIFDASRAALLGADGAGALEALHQSYPMLAVRMPSARVSLM